MKLQNIITTTTLLALLSVTASVSAQKTDKGRDTTALGVSAAVKYRADVGYRQLYRYGDYIVKSPYHIARIGFSVEFPLQKGFGVETGLKYSYGLGTRQQLYAHADTAFFNYSAHLIDVPVRLTYSLPIFWGMTLFGYAGPNINIGLAQAVDVSYTAKKTDVPNPIAGYPTSGTYDLYRTELNRVAIQLGAGGGVQWKNYRLRGGYDWGVNNIGKTTDRPEWLRGWHVAFEYEF